MIHATTIQFTDCRDCPFRRSHHGHGECWEECVHPDHGRKAYENILWGCREEFEVMPAWCPVLRPNTATIQRPGPTRPIGPRLEELVREHYGLSKGDLLKMIVVTVTENTDQLDAVTVLRNIVSDEDALAVLRSAVAQVEGRGRVNGIKPEGHE